MVVAFDVSLFTRNSWISLALWWLAQPNPQTSEELVFFAIPWRGIVPHILPKPSYIDISEWVMMAVATAADMTATAAATNEYDIPVSLFLPRLSSRLSWQVINANVCMHTQIVMITLGAHFVRLGIYLVRVLFPILWSDDEWTFWLRRQRRYQQQPRDHTM